MAEKDISRQAVEGAATTLNKAQKRLRDLLPYGPTRVGLSREDLQRISKSPRPGAMEEILRTLGPEKAIELLTGQQSQSIWPGE